MAIDDDLSRRCVVTENRVLNTYEDPTDYASTSEIAKQFDVVQYKKSLYTTVVVESENEGKPRCFLEIDIIGCDAPIANAIRRVLLAEVPTMAFDRVYLYQNTSVVQDEVLTHRMGLLPLDIDPRPFKFASETSAPPYNGLNTDIEEEPTPLQDEAVVFNIDVTCSTNRSAPPGSTIPEEKYINPTVYSRDFEFIPIGDQSALLAGRPPKMIFDDIVVAKLRPGQQIEAKCHALKGIGRDHAKFSPVATAYYRLLPQIKFKRRFFDKEAELVQKSFSMGVVNLIKTEDGKQEAVLINPRVDMCSRNIFRHPHLAKDIEMTKKKDHFLFSIESTGALTSAELLNEACLVLEAKCRLLRRLVDDSSQGIYGRSDIPMVVE